MNVKDRLLARIKRRYFYKAVVVVYWLRFIPFLRMVGLNGSMVRGHFFQDSDLDFLIITEKGRIYFVRQLVMFLLTVFRLKRSDQKSAGKICPNRWATVNRLQISPQDEYHAWTFAQTVPLYATKKVYTEFISANQWMVDFDFPIQQSKIIITDNRFTKFCKKVSEKALSGYLGNYLEKIFQDGQVKKIDHKLKKSDSRWNITLSDDELCFHLKRQFVQRNLSPKITKNE